MKLKTIIALLLLLITSIQGAYAQKQVQHNTKTTVVKAALSISFYSIGTGINHKAYSAVLAAVAAHNKKYRTNIKYTETSWGREGERDLCFPPQKAKNFPLFMTQMKKKCAGYKQVKVATNAPCKITL